jgi:hypothetical protein
MNGDDEVQKPLDPPQVTYGPMETEGTPIRVIASVEVILNEKNKSQLTKGEIDGVVFYVRENAGEGKLWLELSAPDYHWLRISGIVKCEDSLEREVRKNDDFTAEWAEKVLADGAKA